MKGILAPDAKRFEADSLGYSSLAWHKWGFIRELNGFPTDIKRPPTAKDLKDPVLWLAHAHALSEAAVCLIKNDPPLSGFPENLRTICHSQYYAVALMLVGYSLEVCLKAMILISGGVDDFLAKERAHFHHDLNELSGFVPGLSEKDRAILKALSHFVTWAGRYPDPGSKRVDEAVDVFEIAESYQVTARDLFDMSTRVMQHVKVLADQL